MHDIIDYDEGMTSYELGVFTVKATKQHVMNGRQRVEGMAIALASLFKSEVLQEYMNSTKEVIDELDKSRVTEGLQKSKRSKKKASEAAHEQKMKESMKNLGTLTSFMQGTLQ